MFFSADFLGSRGNLILALCAAAFVVLAMMLGPGRWPATDAMDGTYTNPDCPDFEVLGGELRFGQTRLPGTVERRKGFKLSADRELRYLVGPQGCSLVLADEWAKHPAITREAGTVVTGIVLYSADRSENRVWTKVDPPTL